MVMFGGGAFGGVEEVMEGLLSSRKQTGPEAACSLCVCPCRPANGCVSLCVRVLTLTHQRVALIWGPSEGGWFLNKQSVPLLSVCSMPIPYSFNYRSSVESTLVSDLFSYKPYSTLWVT